MRILLLLSFLVGLSNLAISQSFYDLNTIQTIEITFDQPNWDALMDAEKAGDENYILAKSISINGTVLDSVGVKYKGNSTYNANQTKNPLHIELNTYKDQDYDGFNDIKLSNVAKDPSFLREVLSYHVLGKYMDAPQSNYTNVYINGDLIGLYSNSEAISKKFVNRYFYSKSNTFIKCNPPAGAGPQSNDFPSLEYLGQDSTAYYDAYELKSDDGWHELIELCDVLLNDLDNIDQVLDVDRALWMLAYDNVLVNLDSYIGGFKQNYYLYKQDNGQFAPVVWDLNESFGRFSMSGAGNLNGTTAKQRMDHLLHENDSSFPLIRQLLSVPTYKRMYLAHFKTIVQENFENSEYFNVGMELQNLIDADVQADNNKFFTYNNFISNLTTDVNGGGGPGGGATPGITNLMDGRSDYILALSDFTATEPTIDNISLSSINPIINDVISITASVTQANDVFLGYRDDVKLPFTRIEMFDDGQHNDGSANDGVFGVDLDVTNTYTQYYIYAENDEIGLFSPRRAEHEYHSFTATTTNNSPGDLVINECLASNDFDTADQDGEYDDWIELYNNSNAIIDLDGYTLSDDATDLSQWAFPSGTVIAANGYLTIWADNDEGQTGLHTNFKLSASSDQVFLVDPNGDIMDEISFIDQQTDVSYGRFPNGTGNFQKMVPTFGAENIGTSKTLDTEIVLSSFQIFPNPTSDLINIRIDGLSISDRNLEIYNGQGNLVKKGIVNGKSQFDISDLSEGMYIVKMENRVSRFVKI